MRTKHNALLAEIGEHSSESLIQTRINSLTCEGGKTIGFQLDMPDHFIPSCLYEEQANWIYTVMCRAYIQPLSEQDSGAVDFVIPTKRIAELLVPLTNEALKRRISHQTISDSATDREIQYRLLTHFLEIEKLTETRCTYSTRPAQKPYKGPTCFASNIKLLLPVMFTIMIKPATTPEQWKQFNDKIKEYIIDEMSKAKVSLKEFKQSLKTPSEKAMAPEQVAYKLVTALSSATINAPPTGH